MAKGIGITAIAFLAGSILAPAVSAASLTGRLAVILEPSFMAVPEPSSMLLLCAGLASLAVPLRNRFRR